MDKLLALRIALTIGAVLGIAPVTFAFACFAFFLGLSSIVTGSYGYQSLVIGLSTVALCGCWKAYTLAIAPRPSLRREWLAIGGTLLALIWGVLWGNSFEAISSRLIFVMPGITATVMLGVAFWRSRSAA